MPRRICIVGSGSLSSNPRLLKEADALQAAGYDVTAVACDYTDALRSADDEIAANEPWHVKRVSRPCSVDIRAKWPGNSRGFLAL